MLRRSEKTYRRKHRDIKSMKRMNVGRNGVEKVGIIYRPTKILRRKLNKWWVK
jgi:hypothetical protein